MGKKKTNKILEDHGDWLLVDISTPRHPAATMAVDTDVFRAHSGGRIFGVVSAKSKYIYASYRVTVAPKGQRGVYFHLDVIDCGPEEDADHINHGTMSFVDNRRSNLRTTTRTQNMQNSCLYANNRSGVKGVGWSKGKWRARIRVDTKLKCLGRFSDKSDAIAARQAAERKYFGEYAHQSD